jgi:hypothetical protein
MNRFSRIAWVAALVLAAVCVVVWLCLDRAVAQKREQARDLLLKRAATIRQLTATRVALPGSEKTRVPHQKTAAVASALPTEGESLLHNDALRRTLLRAWSARAYDPFYRATGLTQQQIDAFQQAVLAHWMRWADIMEASRDQGVSPSDKQTWSALGKSESAQFRKEESEALGPELLLQLDQFERRMPMKPVADAVAGAVFDSGEPLSADRAAALVDVLANNSSSYGRGGKASLDDLDVPTAMTQLQVILTPRQLAALRSSLETRVAAHDLMQRIRKSAAGRER